MADHTSRDVLDHLVSDLESVFRGRLEAVVLYGASAHLPGSRAADRATSPTRWPSSRHCP